MARRPRGQLRQDILDAVTDLLMQTGDVDSVSIDQVVERVGCTPPALYYYFPTKSELLRQACAAEFERLAEHLERGVADVQGAPMVQLVRRGYGLLHWAREHPALFRVLFMGSGLNGSFVEEDYLAAPSLQATQANIEEAIERGLAVRDDPRRLTLTLWGMAHGYAALSVSFPSIPMSELESALTFVMRASADALLTEKGRMQWEMLQPQLESETAEPGGAQQP